MNEKKLLSLGFKINQWHDEGHDFTEYVIGNGEIGIVISGITLVELTIGNGKFITVPNCDSIEKLEQLIHLFNIK
jgi:hypothetical protein